MYLASVLIEMIVAQDVNQEGQVGTSSSELVISNTQLRHAGRYSCTAQTPVDNITASAELVVRGQDWDSLSSYKASMNCHQVSMNWAADVPRIPDCFYITSSPHLRSPGPPGGVRVDEVMTSSVRVTWSHGRITWVPSPNTASSTETCERSRTGETPPPVSTSI